MLSRPPGTPLGDPVEINAATSVLLPGARRSSPLALLASKSWHGHGEPAAGLVAAQHAMSGAGVAARHPLLHLRTLNPYSVSVLDLAQGGAGGVAVARQPSALPAVGGVVNSGVSGFAFMVRTGGGGACGHGGRGRRRDSSTVKHAAAPAGTMACLPGGLPALAWLTVHAVPPGVQLGCAQVPPGRAAPSAAKLHHQL